MRWWMNETSCLGEGVNPHPQEAWDIQVPPAPWPSLQIKNLLDFRESENTKNKQQWV